MANKSPQLAGLREGFDRGYRSREDLSALPPNVLVTGSHDVMTNTFRRVGNRRGYVLDGQRDAVKTAGIYGSFDWITHIGTERNLRAGFNTTGTNGKLQYRYVATAGDKYLTNTFTAGQVYWIDLYTLLGAAGPAPTPIFDACRFWDFDHELKDLMLFVDGGPRVFMWSGGVTTLKARTANTLTLNSPGTWASNGFLSSATYTQQVTINGTVYTYTGGADTDTLTGVAPNPSAEPLQSVVHQTPVLTLNSAITGIPATFNNALIENLNNQIYLAAYDNNSVYVSKENEFDDFGFSSPRQVGEGAILTLDGVPTALQQQSDSMFISAGKNYWYQTKFSLSSGNNLEALEIMAIKTTANQAARSQGLTTKIKNLIAFVSSEVQLNTLGLSANFLTDPQVSDISFPIINDVNATDFTDGQILYHRKFLYVTAPKDGVMFIYNMTQDITDGLVDTNQTHYWEAPQFLPFGRLSIIGGELYGHGYTDGNTYKLFTGYSDDNKPFTSLALFAYDPHGDRTTTKSSQNLFVEGYKTQATKLTAFLRRNYNGPVAKWSWQTLTEPFITIPTDDVSIGKSPIGESPIGSSATSIDPDVPPKFRLFQTYPKTPYFEEQIGFGSDGVGQRWEILSFGTDATETTENQSAYKDPPIVT